MKLELSIFREEINDHKGYGSLLMHKLMSWKIVILTLKIVILTLKIVILTLKSSGKVHAYEKVEEPCTLY